MVPERILRGTEEWSTALHSLKTFKMKQSITVTS